MNLIPGWLYGLGGAVATLVLCGLLYDVRVNHLEKEWQDKLQAAVAAEQAKDIQATAKAEDRANGLQADYNRIDQQLAAAKRVQPARCVPVYISRPGSCPVAGQPVASAGGDERPAGLQSDYLLDFAARCEKVVSDFNYCRRSLDDRYKANGQ